MKKNTLLTFLMCLIVMCLYAQNIEVVGKAKITVMDTVTDVSANVVRQSDGTLALRQYKIGDLAQGGIVFWVDETGEHGLVSSMTDLEPTPGDSFHQWSTAPENTASTGDGIGSGAMNTMLIVSAQRGDEDSAARLCADLEEKGYGDWYLPSKEELNLMWKNLDSANLGGFESTFYWSSTEDNSDSACDQDFLLGDQDCFNKDSIAKVRAVRAF